MNAPRFVANTLVAPSLSCARFVVTRLVLAIAVMFVCLSVAQAQIHVTEARIGCLPIQKDRNLTGRVGNACNGKLYCSYKAPNPQANEDTCGHKIGVHPGNGDHLSVRQWPHQGRDRTRGRLEPPSCRFGVSTAGVFGRRGQEG